MRLPLFGDEASETTGDEASETTGDGRNDASPDPVVGESFDDPGVFAPAHLPEPGSFLTDHRVLRGDDHTAFHEQTRAVFAERGVSDATFGYNLAALNRDRRHPDAGLRYAVERADGRRVLRAEFTPTTAFCPQATTLAVGAARAWNGLADRPDYDYDLVRVRVTEHHDASAVNERLRGLAERVVDGAGVDTDGDDTDSAGGDTTG